MGKFHAFLAKCHIINVPKLENRCIVLQHRQRTFIPAQSLPAPIFSLRLNGGKKLFHYSLKKWDHIGLRNISMF